MNPFVYVLVSALTMACLVLCGIAKGIIWLALSISWCVSYFDPYDKTLADAEAALAETYELL